MQYLLEQKVFEEEVVGVTLANKPGTLGEVAGRLGSPGVTISHTYSGAVQGSKKQLVIIAVTDIKQAMKALG